MRTPILAALGVAAYLLFLAAGMPASFVLARAQAAAPGAFEVREASGTAWRGNAALTLATAAGPVALDRVAWTWRPARLLAGRLGFDVAAGGRDLELRAETARTLTHWEARDLDARGNAASLAALLPWIAAWRPEGSLALTSPRLESDGREVRGSARLEWRGAAVSLADVKPLGTYRADVEAEGPRAQVRVETLEGPLRITGRGTFTAPGRITFSGEARPEPAAAAALEPLLRLLGPARADGARTIEWRAP